MEDQHTKRKLAAILAADVAGYSRLMTNDEEGTLRRLKEHLGELVEPYIAVHQGRIVKRTGDGLLVDFASAVEAVRCAIAIQSGMADRNRAAPDDSCIEFRIGINLGDVIIDGDDIYGDGVNIAARLESIAEPGAIFVSRAVRDSVRDKLEVILEDLGEKPVKNIARPVRVFRIGRADGTRPAPLPPTVPDRPSIAVLPFANMSSDAEQQYFSDGITEDIITELSRYHSLLVIARNSCFQFRGSSADTAAVRRALGVRYIVEGSIRKIGNRIRVTVQLIDAVTQTHVWAERYEPIANDIFAVQDEIARAVASTLEGRVAASGAEHARRKPTNDWAAYDYFLQGREQFHRYHFVEAEPFFARAVELDHGYAQAYALRAGALVGRYWNDLKPDTMDEAMSCAQRALSLDDTDPWCQGIMGFVLTHRGQRDLAGPYFDRAIALNPADVQIAYMRAWWLVRVGRAKEALQTLDIAFQRDPFPPRWFWETRAIALFVERRYDDVIGALNRMNQLHSWDHAYVAACHAYRGRLAEARAAASDVLRADPHFTISLYARTEGYTLPTQLKHLLEGFRKAGLPE